MGYGYSGVEGLNALIGVASTPTCAPVITGARLRKGATSSARGAARFVAENLANARAAGAGGPAGDGLVITRLDSAFYNAGVVAAARRGGARFSITARMDKAVQAAITSIEEGAWTPIRYPNAIWEESEQRWISDAEVAEIDYTAFTSRPKADHVSARLIVRRVKRLNPMSIGKDQGELFAAYRHHAIFTDSPLQMLQARPATAATRSSNKSTPTSRAAPWRTYLQHRSPRTRPGWSARRSRSTSPAPRGPWPRPSTPRQPPPPSAASSSPSPPASPDPLAES